jgi:hypothetical protein
MWKLMFLQDFILLFLVGVLWIAAQRPQPPPAP